MKRGTPDHPKLKALMVALNVEKCTAVGVLEMLWHFTARYAADGDIGRFSDEQIAAAIGWTRRSGKAKVSSGSFLVRALVDTRWLDGPYEVPMRSSRGHTEVHRRCLLVHDWEDHADQTLKRFLASRKLAFASPPLPEACSLKPIASNLKPLPEKPVHPKSFEAVVEKPRKSIGGQVHQDYVSGKITFAEAMQKLKENDEEQKPA